MHGPRLSPKYADMEDEYGVRLGDIQDALDSLSEKAMEQVTRRFTTATSNYLYGFNLPETPAQLLRFAQLVATTTLSTSIVDGAVKVTKSALASTEEREERKREDERESAVAVDTRALAEVLGQARTGEPTSRHPGGYL